MPKGLLIFNNTLLTPPKWTVSTVLYNGIWSEAVEIPRDEEKLCDEHYDFFYNHGKWTEVEYEIKVVSGRTCAITNVRDLINKKSVDHPTYYGGESNPYEVIKVCEAWALDKDAYLFNVVKYVARAGKKNVSKELEDLEKAVFYLKRKIENLKNEKK